MRPVRTLTVIAALALPVAGGIGEAGTTTGRGAAQGRGRPPAVRVWIDEVKIPTYPLGAEDPNPHFFALEGTIIYPYARQDTFGSAAVERTYRAVFIENEYLRVMVLPEIGGRIQSVLDKTTGQEMFYRNRVIRPGHIALRGAWVSGGVEWNRGPQGHTVTSFDGVDVLPVQNSDGSASLLIGYTEHNFRTGWQVRLTLHPQERLLDEQIRLFNPTDGFHPYYFWNNTAFPNTPGTRFIFPMSLGTDHAGTTFFSWPVHEGRDLTWLRNYPEPTSVFGHEVEFDFFGAYDVDRDFGIVQVADHHVLPGKKAWTWGQADAGLVAQSVLTDDDGPYIEVQSGPLPTQADFGMLAPGQEIAWQEFWYPVAGLVDGFEYATRYAAIQRIEQSAGTELRIFVTRPLPGARLRVERAGGHLEQRQIDMSPSRTEAIVIGHGADPSDRRMSIVLESGDGVELLRYESPLAIPVLDAPTLAPDAAPATASDHYRHAYELDRSGDPVSARAAYARSLEIDPGHGPAMRALGVLDLESGVYDDAAARFHDTLDRLPDDGLAWYLLAVAELKRGDHQAAIAAGHRAALRAGTAALGNAVIGRARARGGDYDGALRAFTAALAAGGADWTRLFEQILLATYGAGRAGEATALARPAIQSGTLRLVPYLVQALASEDGLRQLARSAREWVAEPEFAFIEASLTLADLGLVRDAANVIEATLVAGLSPESRRPLPLYYLAYLHDLLGEELQTARWLAEARRTTADQVFPSRPETLAVLEFATARAPDDAVAWAALGNLQAGLGRLDAAARAWRRAVDAGSGASVPRRNLAFYEWRVNGDLDAAAALLAQAVSLRPADQTLHRDLARVRVEQGRHDLAINVLNALPAATRRADATLMLARSLVAVGQADIAIDLLASTQFVSREGDTGTWQAFSSAHIARGRSRMEAGDPAAALTDFESALTYPANLNAGRPHRPREARANYWRGEALAALGRSSEAAAARRECAAGAALDDIQIEFIDRCRALLEGPGDR